MRVYRFEKALLEPEHAELFHLRRLFVPVQPQQQQGHLFGMRLADLHPPAPAVDIDNPGRTHRVEYACHPSVLSNMAHLYAP